METTMSPGASLRARAGSVYGRRSIASVRSSLAANCCARAKLRFHRTMRFARSATRHTPLPFDRPAPIQWTLPLQGTGTVMLGLHVVKNWVGSFAVDPFAPLPGSREAMELQEPRQQRSREVGAALARQQRGQVVDGDQVERRRALMQPRDGPVPVGRRIVNRQRVAPGSDVAG